MARGRGVTCRDCGCLNFSTEHDVCDKCRSTFARRSSSSAGQGARRAEDATSSLGKKRRLSDSTSGASNKRQEHLKPALSTKKKPPPDIIDLVSSDEEEEEEVGVQKVPQDCLTTHQQETKTQEDEENEQDEKVESLFQSRVFPSVKYQESDFPSPEIATSMRKEAGAVRMSRKLTLTNAKSAPVAASQPAQENKRDLKPVEPKLLPPVPEVRVAFALSTMKAADAGAKTKSVAAQPKVKTVKQPSTSGKAGGESNRAPAQPGATSGLPTSTPGEYAAAESGSAPHPPVGKDVNTLATAGSVNGDEEKADTPQQSREFESIAFKSSDFVTVFDGLAVARRSHPPTGAVATSTPAVQATTPKSSVRSSATEAAMAHAAQQPSRALIPTPTSTAAVSATSKTSVTASAAVPTATSTTKPSSSTSKATVTTTAALGSTSGTAAVAVAAAVPTATSTKTVSSSTSTATAATTPSSGTKVVATSAAVPTATSPTKVSNLTSKATVATTAASSSTSATEVVEPSAPTAKSTTTVSSLTPKVTTATTAASTATVTGSVVQTISTTASKSGATQRHAKLSSTGVLASSDGDGVAFVKTIAARREIVAAEPPALGFCSSAFMEFMRECGETDGDDENDPEALSSSQLRLLDVIDLTNLSDSEESDAESPVPTPRAGELKGAAMEGKVPAHGQPGATVQASVIAPAQASGTGTWFVPTLDSDRRRTQPEKVMCELCEEKGSPYRLIHCPTCTKYYHKKCAKENGDENVCWNCELGSMIDDSELDQEHAKHQSEYLAYLKAIRHASSSADEGEEEEPEGEEGTQTEGQEGGGDGDVEMTSPAAGGEDKNPFTEGSGAGARWKEFIGDATADIDAAFHEVTNRIAEELRDDEKRRQYSRGFVSREEYEEQMAEVEEYYISEEARLQQLEREKALETKKAAQAKNAQEAAAQTTAPSGEQPSSGENGTASGPPAAVQGGVNTVVAAPSTAPTATPMNNAAPVPTTVPTTVPLIAPAPAPIAALRAALSYVPAPTAAYFASMRPTFMRAAPGAPPPSSNP